MSKSQTTPNEFTTITREEGDKYITFKPDVRKADVLTEDQYVDYITLLIFSGDDGRLWCKHGHLRVYYDRLNKYYDLKTKEWKDK